MAWPAITRDCLPHAYWWWMGSAVDRTNLAHELQRYHDAGLGGVHIIPIYGAKGWESNYISYLSPRWMEMLAYTINEAHRLDLDVDMTTGTGWCFGGPKVTDQEANAAVVTRVSEVQAGGRLTEKYDRASIQALVAYGEGGKCVELTGRIRRDGTVNWTAPPGVWRVYAVSQRPSGMKVKRAAPGGEGPMLNLFYGPAMRHYLNWFEQAFAGYNGPRPRAMYHDSYEYNSNWSPDLFAQFARRRGYRLETELPALFNRQGDDHAARVKCDFRETLSDLMAEETLPQWARWCREHGMLTRNEAHGSPGNLLDLYALADIPETEMFHLDRNVLVSKFASSAAHVTGRRFVAAETGTWLKEHFTETLADMKYLLDDLFMSGINQVFYHGTCYSPDEAPWPGWVFYASYEMNPRNSLWHNVPALNAYAARCQSILQAGQPDNDILLYWPIHDLWHNNGNLEQKLTVHAREWLEGQPIGRAAAALRQRGFSFDFISDRQLAGARVTSGEVTLPGGRYRVVVAPACQRIPLDTMKRLLSLAKAGPVVIFENALPQDVPGWGNLEQRRAALRKQIGGVKLADVPGQKLQSAVLGKGSVLVGDLEDALQMANVPRETLADHPGLQFIRRRSESGHDYFIANRGEQPFDGWLRLGATAKSAVLMDALSGRTEWAPTRQGLSGKIEVWLQLGPGDSLIVRALDQPLAAGPQWIWLKPTGAPTRLEGTWQVRFVAGGPQLPQSFTTNQLASWTGLGGPEAESFAGTALYTTRFDAPGPAGNAGWLLDLGEVCHSARVRLNGKPLGTLFTPPFQAPVSDLKPAGNLLEIEVTNLSANRIRDLDRRKVPWRNFRDINFVNINYRPFDASEWPLDRSGLLGPVTISPADQATPPADTAR